MTRGDQQIMSHPLPLSSTPILLYLINLESFLYLISWYFEQFHKFGNCVFWQSDTTYELTKIIIIHNYAELRLYTSS